MYEFFNPLKSLLKSPAGKPVGGVPTGAPAVSRDTSIPVKNLDNIVGEAELENDLFKKIEELEKYGADYIDKVNNLLAGDKFKDHKQIAEDFAEKVTEALKKFNNPIERFEDGEINPVLLEELTKIEKEAEGLLVEIADWVAPINTTNLPEKEYSKARCIDLIDRIKKNKFEKIKDSKEVRKIGAKDVNIELGLAQDEKDEVVAYIEKTNEDIAQENQKLIDRRSGAQKTAIGKENWEKFLGEGFNKNWESLFGKARSKIIYPTGTKDEYLKKNPSIKLDDSFPFDLGEKLDVYLEHSDDHVDAFHADEKELFRKVFAAVNAIVSSDLPLKSVVLDGITYGIVEQDPGSVKKATKTKPNPKNKTETDAEKEERMKTSRAGAQITLQRVDKWKDLDVVGPSEKGENKGNKNFIAKTRELWKEFAVHGRLEKNSKTGEFEVIEYSDLDGKCCVELLKQAGIDTADLKFVAPGSFEEGRINMDTGGKHGVVAENFNDPNEKTAYIDHHGEKSPSNSSAAAIMYKMLVDLGLLKKSDQFDKMIGFVTDIDSGNYPEIDKYFENSWKTLYGMERFIQGENLVQFFKRNTDSNLNRELTEAELESCGLIIKDRTGEIVENKCEKQERVAKKSKESLERMKADGFIVPSARYGKIAVSVESGVAKKKNVPGGFLAARAFGCDAYISWNPKENKFYISSKVPLTEKYSQGLKVREIMWVKNDGSDEELKVTLGEILKKMTDGKLVASGKLKEYLEEEVAHGAEPVKAGIEKKENKNVAEAFAELQTKSRVFALEGFQMWYNEYKEIAKECGLRGEKKNTKIKEKMIESIGKILAKHSDRKGEDAKKITLHIFSLLK